MRFMLSAGLVLTPAMAAWSTTTELEQSLIRVEDGVAFELGNIGASDYTFTWTDDSGTTSGEVDPTLVLTVGETYTFERFSPSHPFVITDDTLPITGSDGSFSRTTTDGTAIDNATLSPIADFTADPSAQNEVASGDAITWTPSQPAGNQDVYYYTCRITGHTGMTGQIIVTAGSDLESGTVPFDEATDGDLSNDRLAPTAFTFANGSNVIAATQQGDSLGRDIDYFAFEVPAGSELASISLTNYVAEPNNLAFLGIQSGATFTEDPASPDVANILGGITYGAPEISTDILPAMGTLGGAIGFTPPLPAGIYTVWLNQTGNPSTATLDFVVQAESASGPDRDGDGIPDDADAFPDNPLGATDSDLDGLGDEWEQLFFGDLTTADGTSDSDFDGVLDIDEFSLPFGFDPTDGTTELPVSAIPVALALAVAAAAALRRRR